MARVIVAFLCLLLIAATPTPLPRHYHQTHKPKAAAEQAHDASSPILSPSYQPSSESTAATSRNYTYNYYNPPSKSESPPVWFQVGTTVVLIFFTGGLWLTSIWQWRALKEQAGVAEKAVKAAELALNTELPYVFVEVPKMITRAEPVTDPDPALAALGSSIFGPFITGVQNPLRFAVSYELRNRGKGLAIIDGLKARFHLARTIWDAPTNEEQRRMKTIPLEVRERVIGPADNSINYVYDVYLVPSTWSKILPHKLELVLVGFIRFHDVFERKYRQDFCYRYLVGSFDAQTLAVNVDWFFAGPPKNNKYHRYIIATRIPACPSQNSRPKC